MLTRSNSCSTRSIVRLYYMYSKYISPIIESIEYPRRPKYRRNGQTKRVPFQSFLCVFFYKFMPNPGNYPCFRMVGNLHWSSMPGEIPGTTPPSLNNKHINKLLWHHFVTTAAIKNPEVSGAGPAILLQTRT